MFGRKKEKPGEVKKQTAKNGSTQAVKKQAVKSGSTRIVKKQTVKKQATKSGSARAAGAPAAENARLQEKREKVLDRLTEMEKEAGLEQARDSVGQLEDEKIAEHIELLLKIMQSGE